MKNKIVVITGASSGIGEATARLFAKHGARLILCARRTERLQKLAEDLNTETHILTMDVRDKQDVAKQFANLPENWQAIDILINNAGLALSSDPIQMGNIENWETMIDTNIKGLLYVTHAILPGMQKRQRGHIVNIGSVAGQECYPNGNVYCATKHAVRALNTSLRIDLLGQPIRVSEVAPGAVETEFSTVRWNDPQKAADFYNNMIPLQAMDIADAIYFCVSRPEHVDVSQITIMPTIQASANHVKRKETDV